MTNAELNLAVATKLSSMGQEWGWEVQPDPKALAEHVALYGRGFAEGIPLNFCADPAAFGRLVEYCARRWGVRFINDSKDIKIVDFYDDITGEWLAHGVGETIEVALAQTFIGGGK